jgi:colicin import membrane protein
MEIFASQPAPQSIEPDRDFNLGLRWSLSLHLALAVFVLVKSLIFPGEVKTYTPTLRVDIVGLPDLLKKDLANIRPSTSSEKIAESLKEAAADAKKIKPKSLPPEVAEAAKPDEMVLKPKTSEKAVDKDIKKRNQSALSRIKALAKLGIDSPSPSKGSPVLIKGNAISKGTSLSADARESSEENYYDRLRDRLQENWALPVWLARQNLSARVQIYVDSRGRLRGFKMIKGSGNAQFDEAVKQTLNVSQPFPPPPDALASSVLSSGVLVGFPL